eukprot:5787858-Ditylum_brightwellii.AAC.1
MEEDTLSHVTTLFLKSKFSPSRLQYLIPNTRSCRPLAFSSMYAEMLTVLEQHSSGSLMSNVTTSSAVSEA